MAKVLATVSGVALKPGLSRNRRLYTREAIASAVGKAQAQLAEGAMPLRLLEPLTQRTHHAADDDSTRIVGRVRSLTVTEDGSARFTADIADTPHGRTIAALLDSSDGEPFLKGVSIRGAWDGRVRRERGPDGQPCETASSLTLHGLDYTASPGVPGAEVDTFAWAADGTSETTERVLITESVQEAHVTSISEETAPDADSAVAEAGAVTAAPAGTTYADPGYLKDGKKRYPLDTQKHVRAAWSFISQQANASQYTGPQLKRIKGKIKAAMVKLGAKITDEGWSVWPAEQVTESGGLAESGGGSFSVCASNGPVNVSVSSYCIDPADLELILAAAAKSAFAALKNLDPDMDADIDVPGADAEDTDGDAARESADPDPAGAVTETAPAAPAETGTTQAPAPAAATNSKEGSAMGETTTTEAAQAPAALTRADIAAVVTETLNARDEAAAEAAKAARKAEKKAAKRAAAESAKPAAGQVTESAEDIEKLIDAKVNERLAAEGVVVTETTEQLIDRKVNERVTAAKQALTESGQGPARKGLVTEHSAARQAAEAGLIGADGTPSKPLHELSNEEFTQLGDMMADHFLGPAPSRAE